MARGAGGRRAPRDAQDTGVDFDHPDLKANIVESKDKPGIGKDDDKNRYVDDAHGFNAIKGKGFGKDDE